MRVNLLSLYAGPRGSWGPGVCELPDDIGQELIEAQVAVPVVETRGKSVAVETVKPVDDEIVEPVRRGSRRVHAPVKPGDDDEEET